MREMFGLVALTFFLLGALALQGGSAAALWSWHAFVVVIGGSATAAFMSFPADRVLAVPRLIWEALRPAKIEMVEVVARLMKLSNKLRSAGIQGTLKDINAIDDPFLKRGMQYITEGFDSQEIQDLLEAEMLSIRGRHRTNISVFESLGGYCPTLGILGTVMSMVSVSCWSVIRMAVVSVCSSACRPSWRATLHTRDRCASTVSVLPSMQ